MFEFFDAVAPEMMLIAMAHLAPNLLELQDAMSILEQACFMSYVMLWYKCVEDGLPYIAIFEDDVLLGKGAYSILSDDSWLKDLLGESSFIVKLETYFSKVNLTKPFMMVNSEYSLCLLRSAHYGTGGYIVSQHMAKLLLENVRRISSCKSIFETVNIRRENSFYPIDVFLFEKFLNRNDCKIFQLCSAVCAQTMFFSEQKLVDKKKAFLFFKMNWYGKFGQ